MAPARRAQDASSALSLSRHAGVHGALALVALRVAQERGSIPRPRSWSEALALARELRGKSGGAFPPWALPPREPSRWRDLEGDPDALIAAFEQLAAEALGRRGRRGAGLYYTPPDVAAEVVALAARHGARAPRDVLDPCAGGGAFLVAAARAGLRELRGLDLDAEALRVARAALWLEGVATVELRRADALREGPRADLVVGNPPYGHVDDPAERAALSARWPELRGGEIDRYAAFILRAVELVRPGGTVALLVPDTWMTNARAGAFRAAVLERAHLSAVSDLGKPFAAAKDTRVQAIVLVRSASRLATWVGREGAPLSPAPREELVRGAGRGWQIYRSRGERALCEEMERPSVPLGDACEVGYGLRTGDNGRHVARRAPRMGEVGLVGGEDIVPFAVRWKAKALVDGAEFQGLVERQRGRPRIAVQRIRTNAQASWARWLEAAEVEPDRVCLDSLSTISAASRERLEALLGLVCSVAWNRFHRLRTTDVNVKPSALRELPVPRGLLEHPEELAALVRERSHLDPSGVSVRGMGAGRLAPGRARDAEPTAGWTAHDLERRIDALVYRLFDLPEALVRECERGFWGERFPEEWRLLGEAARALSDPPATVAGKEVTG